MAEGQIDQCRDLLCQLPQRRQEQRQAAELIHKERARRRQIFSRLAHTGKNHAVSAAYVHFRQRCQKLMLTFRRQRVNTGKVKGGVRPCQGRVVVLQQKGPALIAEKAAVDEDQRVVSQASRIYSRLTTDSFPVPSSPVTTTGDLLRLMRSMSACNAPRVVPAKLKMFSEKAASASGLVEKRMPV